MNEIMQQTGAILTVARVLQNLTGFANLSGFSGVAKPVRFARCCGILSIKNIVQNEKHGTACSWQFLPHL